MEGEGLPRPGREFGKLTRCGMITYSLSPLESAPSRAPSATASPARIQASILRVVPPFVGFYLIYTSGTEEFEKPRRKNPATYENDH